MDFLCWCMTIFTNTSAWAGYLDSYLSQGYLCYVKCNQPCPGLELVSSYLFPTTITSTPWAPPYADLWLFSLIFGVIPTIAYLLQSATQLLSYYMNIFYPSTCWNYLKGKFFIVCKKLIIQVASKIMYIQFKICTSI